MNTSHISSNEIQYNESSIRYPYLPSLIECDDTELDDIINDVDTGGDRVQSAAKKDNVSCKGTFNFISKALSEAMDARLDIGLNLHVELDLRRINLASSLSLFSSLPQVMTGDIFTNVNEIAAWPNEITDIWSGPEYNCTLNTYSMFKNVFDSILADLHLQQTWVHMEQVLHMWLTLNAELNTKVQNISGGVIGEEVMPKISFGANAVRGLLMALAWHNDVKLRTWSLGFQCLLMSCNTQTVESNIQDARMNEVIINDDNFEKMLLRFFSGYGMSSSIITNRYVS